MSEENSVLVDREGAVTIISINRPHRRNAVDAPGDDVLPDISCLVCRPKMVHRRDYLRAHDGHGTRVQRRALCRRRNDGCDHRQLRLVCRRILVEGDCAADEIAIWEGGANGNNWSPSANRRMSRRDSSDGQMIRAKSFDARAPWFLYSTAAQRRFGVWRSW